MTILKPVSGSTSGRSYYTMENLTNPYFNSFDKVNLDELLDIALIKEHIWGTLAG